METMYCIGLDVHRGPSAIAKRTAVARFRTKDDPCHTLGRSEARRFSAVVFLTLFLRLLGN